MSKYQWDTIICMR